MNEKLVYAKDEIKKVIQGKDEVIDMVLCTLLANGHILLEDIPGVGKTSLAVALSKTLSMSYKRMQFTPDVLPSDILGFNMLDHKTSSFQFIKGAIFTNLFLADEINRTSPKTQSALLEVMEEHKVSIDGTTFDMPSPFFVIATQNPVGASGTQKLPDSQLDRFFVKLSLGYPDKESAVSILMGNSSEKLDTILPALTLAELADYQKATSEVYVKDSLCSYIVDLVEATRSSSLISQGVSPRGSIAILKMAKAHAFYKSRDYVVAEDIHKVFFSVCNHRIFISTKANAQSKNEYDVLMDVLDSVKVPLA